MTVLNTLILHLKSFKGLGRKKIFSLINDNINIEEITSSKVDIKKILDEVHPKILKYIPSLDKMLLEKKYFESEVLFKQMINKKIRITNIFEHRYKFSNWDGSYHPEGINDDEEWTGKILMKINNEEINAPPGLDLDQILFSSKNKYQDLPIQIFTLEKNGHLLNLTAEDVYDFHGKPNKIAIIGTRNPTKDSAKTANQIAKLIISRSYSTIVSGLAKGIDTAAHEGCLDQGGHTIAVVGHGLDTIYPKENRDLAKKIIRQGGAIVSEYPFGTKAEGFRLVERDRIQALLSHMIILIESNIDGGSMHTIEAAKKMNKKIWCLDIPASGNQKVIAENKNVITFKNFEEFKDKFLQLANLTGDTDELAFGIFS